MNVSFASIKLLFFAITKLFDVLLIHFDIFFILKISLKTFFFVCAWEWVAAKCCLSCFSFVFLQLIDDFCQGNGNITIYCVVNVRSSIVKVKHN